MTSNDLMSLNSRHDDEEELPTTTPPDENNESNTATHSTRTGKSGREKYRIDYSLDCAATEMINDSRNATHPICPVLECMGGSKSNISQSIVESLLYFQNRGEKSSSPRPDADPVSITYPHRLSSLQLDFQDLRQECDANHHNSYNLPNSTQTSRQDSPFSSQKTEKYLSHISRTIFDNPAENSINTSQYPREITSQGQLNSIEACGPNESYENSVRTTESADEIINDISSMPVGLRAAGILPLLSLRIIDTELTSSEKEVSQDSEVLASTLAELSITKEEWERRVRKAYVSESSPGHNLKLSEVYMLMTVESQLVKMKESKCFVPTLTFLAGKIKTTDESWLATALREFHEESAGLLQNIPELSSLCQEIESPDLENVSSTTSALSTEPIPTGKKKRRLFLKKQAEIEAQVKAESRLRQSNAPNGDNDAEIELTPITRKMPFFNPATKMGLIAHDISASNALAALSIPKIFSNLLPIQANRLNMEPFIKVESASPKKTQAHPQQSRDFSHTTFGEYPLLPHPAALGMSHLSSGTNPKYLPNLSNHYGPYGTASSTFHHPSSYPMNDKVPAGIAPPPPFAVTAAAAGFGVATPHPNADFSSNSTSPHDHSLQMNRKMLRMLKRQKERDESVNELHPQGKDGLLKQDAKQSIPETTYTASSILPSWLTLDAVSSDGLDPHINGERLKSQALVWVPVSEMLEAVQSGNIRSGRSRVFHFSNLGPAMISMTVLQFFKTREIRQFLLRKIGAVNPQKLFRLLK